MVSCIQAARESYLIGVPSAREDAGVPLIATKCVWCEPCRVELIIISAEIATAQASDSRGWTIP